MKSAATLPPGNNCGAPGCAAASASRTARVVDVHVHQFGRVLGQVWVVGNHDRQRLAYIAHRLAASTGCR